MVGDLFGLQGQQVVQQAMVTDVAELAGGIVLFVDEKAALAEQGELGSDVLLMPLVK